MTIDKNLWHTLSKLPLQAISLAEQEVVLDQTNLFFRHLSISQNDLALAQSYAVSLCDMLYLFLFRPINESKGLESVKALKTMINARWAKRS